MYICPMISRYSDNYWRCYRYTQKGLEKTFALGTLSPRAQCLRLKVRFGFGATDKRQLRRSLYLRVVACPYVASKRTIKTTNKKYDYRKIPTPTSPPEIKARFIDWLKKRSVHPHVDVHPNFDERKKKQPTNTIRQVTQNI